MEQPECLRVSIFRTQGVQQPRSDGQTQLVSLGSDAVVAYEPATGEIVWQCLETDLPDRCISSPIVAGGLMIVSCGSGNNGLHLIAMRPGEGAEPPAEAYRIREGVPNVPTPVVAGDLLFLWHDRGTVSCFDAATGEKISRRPARLGRVRARRAGVATAGIPADHRGSSGRPARRLRAAAAGGTRGARTDLDGSERRESRLSARRRSDRRAQGVTGGGARAQASRQSASWVLGNRGHSRRLPGPSLVSRNAQRPGRPAVASSLVLLRSRSTRRQLPAARCTLVGSSAGHG
ncbi:MAG: PQQ-binding-like beta-propeller repeat protein, partial [Akkermansiaceae bacterium]|nr:PQQ-binding-like beta-propeller repeat protein [Akkermansiaceae bacterium]